MLFRAGRPERRRHSRVDSSLDSGRREPAAEKREYIRYHRARGLSIVEGCRLMGLSRSTYYGAPTASRVGL